MPLLRRTLLGACMAPPALPARAQGFPQRPLRLVVPFAPGGAADVFARTLAPVLGSLLGQGVVVENAGGAATRLGTAAVARAAADGHTLLVTNDTLAAIEALPLPNAGPALAGLAPVLLGATAPLVLVTHPRSGIANGAAYAARLRARQATNVAVPGLGSTQHFASELLAQALGGRPEHVAYRGAGPMLADLLAGTVDAAMIILGAVVGQLRDGRLVGLGVTAASRAAVAPAVPCFAEALAPGFVAETWIGMLAPAGTPAAVVARLAEAGAEALRQPAVAERLQGLGFAGAALGPDRFAPLLRETVARFSAVAGAIGLKPEDM